MDLAQRRANYHKQNGTTRTDRLTREQHKRILKKSRCHKRHFHILNKRCPHCRPEPKG